MNSVLLLIIIILLIIIMNKNRQSKQTKNKIIVCKPPTYPRPPKPGEKE